MVYKILLKNPAQNQRTPRKSELFSARALIEC